ncbi:MAG: DUF5977 domain-containing protein [Agriterribacter sp.]
MLQKKLTTGKCLKFGALIISIFFLNVSFCQQVNSIVPPSPTVGTLKQFGDFPMDYSTGTINISIPIYTIQAKDFSIPIEMSFNARGRMGGLNYSALGVGWALNCIDYISKEINGKPDNNSIRIEQTKESFLSLTSGPDYDNQFHQLYEKIIKSDPERTTLNGSTITYPTYDILPDVYSYHLNGRSGKYVVNLNNDIVHLTYSTLKFSLGMEVLDEKGNTYKFGSTPVSLENTLWFDPTGQWSNIITTWYLSQIVTAAGEIITYDYESINTSLSNSPIKPKTADYTAYIISKRLTLLPADPAPITEGYETSNVSNTFTYVMPLLKSITYPTGKVEFVYTSTNKKLESIKVLNTSNQIVQTAEFTYINTPGTNYISNNNSISLSNLKIKGRNTNPEKQYSFEYYNVTLPYSSTNNDKKFAGSVDWWGYCNTDGENVPVIAGDADFTNGVNGSKNPNELLKFNGMLKKITYPTGGYTEFSFENNKYKVGTSTNDGPGLRIKEIKSTASYNAKPIIKKITYGDGMLPYFPNTNDFRTQRKHVGRYDDIHNPAVEFVKKTYTPFPAAYVSKLYTMPVYYSDVTETQVDDNGNNLGKTEYYYITPSVTSVLDGNHLKYIAIKDWTQGLLHQKFTYKTVGSSSSLVEQITNTYSQINYVNIPGIDFVRDQELYLYKSSEWVLLNPVGNQTGYLNEELYMKAYGINQIYTIINRPIESAISVKTREEKKTYKDNGATVTVINDYEYSNLINALPTKQTTTGSDGKIKVSQFKYTNDFATIGNLYYNMIANRNLVINLIEQTDFVDGNQVKYVKTNYFSPHTNLFVPQNIVVKNGTGPQFTFYEFKRYNTKGGILEQQSNTSPNEVYFWGYQEQFPVAKVVGTDYTTALTKVTQAQLNTATSIGSNDENVRALLNNLRTIPGAMVNTYTYEPLTGVSSESDVTNRTIYYKYDGLGRLSLIQDHDKNILKKYCYNYQGQTENCNTFFNQVQSGNFTKACTGCTTGTVVTYTVPAGTYVGSTQTDANALAQQDIAANGQAYANTYPGGTCTTPTSGILKGTNQISLKNFTVKLVNANPSCGSTIYTYTLNGGASNVSLGTLPSGNYNVTVTPVGTGSIFFNCSIGGASEDGTSTGVSFTSVPVSNGTLLSITTIAFR